MKIWRAEAHTAEEGAKYAQDTAGAEEPAQPGTVLSVGKNDFTVQTGDGVLRILEVQMPGKKRMETGAFLRGNTMEPRSFPEGEYDGTGRCSHTGVTSGSESRLSVLVISGG